MCGIAGIFTWQPDRQSYEPLVREMCEVIQHRGPDADGIWSSRDGRATLGFRRLAIVDLSTEANQPMSNEDGTLHVLFNGEIYNHAEIRRELEILGGHRWKTDHSDTEVILHAFEQWGISCVRRLSGMFAIALYDSRKHELWLIRDRIGIKPLYYAVRGGKISFASEIKALLKDSEQPRSVNEEALFHFLSFLVAPAPDTIFEGIEKLPRGSWLRIGPGGEQHLESYWEPWKTLQPQPHISEQEAMEGLMMHLRRSVKMRKVSDVPVGVFLSGGVDSSTNTVLFSEGETQPVQTFCVGYDRDYSSYGNEFGFARMVAEQVGAKHHEIKLTQQDLLDFLPRMVELQDEPIVDPVCIPVYFVSKLARDNGVIVCQVGEGADELFCGYPFWDGILQKEQMLKRFGMKLGNRLGMMALKTGGYERSLMYEQMRRAQLGQPLFWGGAEAFTQRGKELLLSPRLRKKFAGHTSWDYIGKVHEKFRREAWEASDLHWMTWLDLNLRLPELLLMRVDKMSMGASIECRVPFLDHKLVEYVLSLPQSVLYQKGQPKKLFKKAVAGLLPAEIINRPKQGFGVPITEWFFDALGDTARATLRQFVKDTDYFDAKEVEELIRLRRVNQLWYLYNFALWWKRYIG